MRIRFYVLGHEGRGRDAEHVDGPSFLLHQLRPRHPHQLDADAHEPDVVDVGRNVRTGAGKSHPGRKGLWRGVNAAPELLRQMSCTMNSPRQMPCVLVFPPRSIPPGFHSFLICAVKALITESRYSSSLGNGFSSASFKCSFVLP